MIDCSAENITEFPLTSDNSEKELMKYIKHNNTSAIELENYPSEVESLALRTPSRTHFEVLGLGLEGQVLGLEGQVLGLEASGPRKLPCPRLENSTIFCTIEILLENARNLSENLRKSFLFSAIGNRHKKVFFIIINGQRR